MTQRQIDRIAEGPKRYEFTGSVLTVSDYFDSKNRIQIDLAKLTPEMLEELAPEPGEKEW